MLPVRVAFRDVLGHGLKFSDFLEFPWYGSGMKTASTDDARRNLRAMLNDVERNGEHYELQRFGETAAVVVPFDWYRRAQEALGEKDGHDED